MLNKKQRTQYIKGTFGESFFALESCDPRIPHTVKEKGSRAILAVAIGLCTNKEGLLCYYDYERGHMLHGKVEKNLKSGIVFKTNAFDKALVFEPLTLEIFNRELRPTLPEEVSERLNTLDDVCIWYRKQADMV